MDACDDVERMMGVDDRGRSSADGPVRRPARISSWQQRGGAADDAEFPFGYLCAGKGFSWYWSNWTAMHGAISRAQKVFVVRLDSGDGVLAELRVKH